MYIKDNVYKTVQILYCSVCGHNHQYLEDKFKIIFFYCVNSNLIEATRLRRVYHIFYKFPNTKYSLI